MMHLQIHALPRLQHSHSGIHQTEFHSAASADPCSEAKRQYANEIHGYDHYYSKPNQYRKLFSFTALAIGIVGMTAVRREIPKNIFMIFFTIISCIMVKCCIGIYNHFKIKNKIKPIINDGINNLHKFNNNILEPCNVQSDHHFILQLHDKDFKDESFSGRIADTYKQANRYKFGYSVFDAQDYLDKPTLEYLEALYVQRGNKPFKTLFWLTHGDYSEAQDQLIKKLTEKKLLAPQGTFIAGGCENAAGYKFEYAKKIAKTYGIHYYASTKIEDVETLSDGYWHFFPDGREPVNERPPLQ